MRELDDYLNWCNSQYKNSNHCQCGTNCSNNHYCDNTLQTDCYQCIKRVHSYKNYTIHYNCEKMLYCYVLKHCYRFVVEIFFEFHRLRSDFINWNEIYILSIGCGPCTELFGAMLQWRKMGKHDLFFHYRGFDTETLWQPFMNMVCSSFTNSDVEADNSNAFIYYQTHNEKVDVIVLNYMLSDMFKFQNNQYDQFLENLINLIRQKKPHYLLVNDIYLILSIGATNRMLRFFKSAGFTFEYDKYQYHCVNPYIGQFGNIVAPKPSYSLPNAEIAREYNPFSQVNSIQTMIKFNY